MVFSFTDIVAFFSLGCAVFSLLINRAIQEPFAFIKNGKLYVSNLRNKGLLISKIQCLTKTPFKVVTSHERGLPVYELATQKDIKKNFFVLAMATKPVLDELIFPNDEDFQVEMKRVKILNGNVFNIVIE